MMDLNKHKILNTAKRVAIHSFSFKQPNSTFSFSFEHLEDMGDCSY